MPIYAKKRKADAVDESDSDDDWEDEDSAGELGDSDTELQDAFARGHLKPGLNAVFEERPQPVNNKERLLSKLEEIKLKLPWIERFDVTNKLAPLAPEIAAEIGIDPNIVLSNNKTTKKMKTEEDDGSDLEELDNVDDDFKRELRFYRQAQGAVLEIIPRLKSMGLPTRRPEDYFAEMAKSDEQMKKIREKLISKQQSMELSEKAKKLREQRKYGKQVQIEVQKKRLEEKKKLAESVKKFRKSGKGKQDELDFMTELEGPNERSKSGKGKPGDRNKPAAAKGPPKKSGKQNFKDSKYGFGGQKKRSKYNTKDSADNVGRFDRKKHGNAPAGNRKPGKAPQKRPGKESRKKMTNKNKR
ncbi:putative rRNA-processing protein EBP2 [Hypsibius exemplaris]|uniref:rRNA-processing protein EBP2 n=1 Tax=Hypsibius exemplaris TaxID=2072580 RepID=A0A1W0X207_HYPEX|nr:putative rRNA-processing protein EBP2 [Hypsibius exemplaris]